MAVRRWCDPEQLIQLLCEKDVDVVRAGVYAQNDSDTPTDMAIWLFFQITAGHILLPLLVATSLFARGLPFHPAVVNLCCTWILAAIVSSLL